jgi:hypothetical protein
MRTLRSIGLSVVVLLSVFGVSHATTLAQGSDLADHPLVGSWLLDTDVESDENSPALAVFTSDGVYIQSEGEGSISIGAWESTGDTSAIMTAQSVSPDLTLVLRATIEVSEDGDSFTAPYSLELVDAAGESLGEYGPGEAAGERAPVEEMGEPDGSLEDLFALFEEPGASPESTPED